MANYLNTRRINRRDFLKMGGGLAVGITSASLLSGPALARNLLRPADIIPGPGPAHRAPLATVPYDVHLIGTDGWAYFSGPAIPPWHPDPWSPNPLFTTYIFGFRNGTGMTGQQVVAQKGRAQIIAPPPSACSERIVGDVV
jgi:hypothetical protein